MYNFRRVLVTPKAGFVIKTTTTQPGFYTAPSLSPPSQNIRHIVPLGLKIFINVAFSPEIPTPPTVALPAEEENEIIKRAIDGDIECTYFVPVVVSHGRPDKDKGTLLFFFFSFSFVIKANALPVVLSWKTLPRL
ncbi:MAG TPA: hypothetical protein VGO47_04915 [Chlamydiales bacterium]|nr:hypothetical protein [Chlamydiales bacterium]